MAEPTQCDKHLFEEATGMCRTCRRPYCADCLVYAHGPDKAPLCVPCALQASGVRSTATKARRGMGGRLLASVAATAATAVLAIPVLSAIH
ncbi:MAG: hypothetical protein JO086_14095 [Acidimicrobiia bacterium]|nr:hypothetical protein [Acidimicrobiia bacterium]